MQTEMTQLESGRNGRKGVSLDREDKKPTLTRFTGLFDDQQRDGDVSSHSPYHPPPNGGQPERPDE